MKKYLLTGILSLGLLAGLIFIVQPQKSWSDVASLTNAAIGQANIIALNQCTVTAGVPVAGTCTQVGVNWTSLLTYMQANVNWQDLPGVTGAPTSAATWLKTTAP